jgi:hypothetical protein
VFRIKNALDFKPVDRSAGAAQAAEAIPMASRNSISIGLAAAFLSLATSALPIHAQAGMTDPDAAVACRAFERNGGGTWTATSPSTLAFDNGMSMRVAPGQSFAPNQTFGGVEISAVLDRNCGNT